MNKSYTCGTIYYKGNAVGVFTIDHNTDTVLYTIDPNKYEMSFNGFETMCEALGYDLKVE